MKWINRLALVILVAFSALGCQKEINSGGSGTPGVNANPVTATLQGNVLDENGLPAAGVTVKAGNKSAVTNNKGYFRIKNAPLDKHSSLVTAEKTGYFKSLRTFSATTGVNQVVFRMIKKSLAGTITTASGGTVSLANGSSIALAADGIMKANGGVYSGTVNVYAAYIDPTAEHIGDRVPGSFLALDKDNKEVLLSSYGMMVVELESPSGEKLQVATGKTAVLTTAIPAGLSATAPAAISLWYVDENTGLWKEEGTATKNGAVYSGEVKHFTYWNCDVAGPTVNLTATFKDANGQPLVAASIYIRPVSGYASAHGYTDSLGQISGPVPANMNLVLEVMSPCYTPAYSMNIGPFSSNTALGEITVNNSSATITLQGTLVDCSNAPVTHGFAMITYDNTVRYVAVQNAGGHFSTSFVTCAASPATCEIIGVDENAQQQGIIHTVTLAAPVTDAGSVSACGTSSTQFINYNVDGTDYTISSLVPGDSFTGHAFDSTTVTGSFINGSHNNSYISFQFTDNRTAGVFPVDYIQLTSQGVASLVTPFNVTITRFPAAGGDFYEGSFNGQFLDNTGGIHTITCTFRVRRT